MLLSSIVAVINETPPAPPAAVAPDLPPGLSDLIRAAAGQGSRRPSEQGAAAAVAAAAGRMLGRGRCHSRAIAGRTAKTAAPDRGPRRVPPRSGAGRRRRRRAARANAGRRGRGADGRLRHRADGDEGRPTSGIHDLKSGPHTWQLDANKYTLGMADDADGLTIDLPDGKPFVLRRKGDGVVTITRQAAKPAVGEAPKDRVPLDALRREDIPRAALGWPGGGDPDQAPPELVAILGDGRFRIQGGGLGFPAISPDGRVLAAANGPVIRLFDASTGQYSVRPVRTRSRWSIVLLSARTARRLPPAPTTPRCDSGTRPRGDRSSCCGTKTHRPKSAA